jgi:ribosomal-protein-alanine N-acetyltransferase
MTIVAAPFRLRAMTQADIPQVTEIEHASFPTSWPSTAYRRELQRNNLARYIVAVEDQASGGRASGVGAWLRSALGGLRAALGRGNAQPAGAGERIVGFLGLWYMVDEAHIVTVAVRPEMRRRGAGELLVAEALELARDRGAELVTLECRVSNTAAQALYEKYGFARAGIRRRYYTDDGEDAVVMTTARLSDPAYGGRLQALRRQYAERYGEVMRGT